MVEDVVEQITVGVDGDAGKPQAPGTAHRKRKVRVQGGLAAEQHQVRARTARGEDRQPAFDTLDGQPLAAVLVGVDVAVPAA